MKSSINAGEVQTIAEMCIQQAKVRPDDVAFLSGNQRSTFRELDLGSNQVGHALNAAGVKLASRVAILGKDSVAHYEILFGCAKIKAVLVDLNWRLAPPEILFILNDSETEVLFVAQEFFPVVDALVSQLTTVRTIVALGGAHHDWPAYEIWKAAQPASTQPAFEYSPDDVTVQMYSSGTTGRPKGVQLANYSFFRLMQGMRAADDSWMSLNPADILLLSLPQFHIGGLWWAIQGYAVGATGVIVDTFVAWQALQLIERHQITKAVLVPAMIQLMLEEPNCEQKVLSSVKGIVYGGSPISPTMLRKAMRTFACEFFQIYGLTETGNMAVCLRPADHFPDSPRLKAAGRPLPGVEIKIVDGQGRTLPPMRSGEICIKSPSNMLGYWKNESATAQTLVDSWVHTGDVGYKDQDGYVYVCDRIKDMIIYAGENLFPAEIEAVLSEHEAVAEVAVIGIPDEKWGEVVKAFVVPRQGDAIKQRELIDFARNRIADFKVPKSITFVDALPRNPSGKVLKRVLRAPFWQDQDRQVS